MENFINTTPNPRKVLTSGKFNPPHIGHLANFRRIIKNYGSLTVVILDYKKREFPISYCLKMLKENCSSDINFIVNTTHFAEITLEELKRYGCDIYVGGNLKVLRHIEILGFPVDFIDRAYYFTASKYPRPE